MKQHNIFKAYSHINKNNIKALKDLLNYDSSLLYFKNSNLENLFLYSCKKDNYEALEFLLLQDSNLINSKNKSNDNFLHLLFKNSSQRTILQLLDSNKINLTQYLEEKNNQGNIPFFYLMAHGTNLTINKFLEKQLTKNQLLSNNNYHQNGLHFLAKNKYIDHVYSDLFTKEQKQQEDNYQGLTPIMIASVFLNKSKFLTFYNNENVKNSLGNSILHLSSKNKDSEVFNFLLENHHNDIDFQLIDLNIANENDAHLESILKNLKYNTYINNETLNIILKKSSKFNKSINYIFDNNLSPQIRDKSKISIYLQNETANNIKDFLTKNNHVVNSNNICTFIDKILNNKKELFTKINYLFNSIDDKLNEEQTLIFINLLKKLPLNQQIYTLSSTNIQSKLDKNIAQSLEKFYKFKNDYEKIQEKISDNLLHLYISNEKNNYLNLFDTYKNTNNKDLFCNYLLKTKIKKFNDINNFQFLTVIDIYNLKNTYIKNQFLTTEFKKEDKNLLEDNTVVNVINHNLIKLDSNLINNDIINIASSHYFKINFDNWEFLFHKKQNLNNKISSLLSINSNQINNYLKLLTSDIDFSITQWITLIKFSHTYNLDLFQKTIYEFLNQYKNKNQDYYDILDDIIFEYKNENLLNNLISFNKIEPSIIPLLNKNFSLEDIIFSAIKNSNFLLLNEYNIQTLEVDNLNLKDLNALNTIEINNFNIFFNNFKINNPELLNTILLKIVNTNSDCNLLVQTLNQLNHNEILNISHNVLANFINKIYENPLPIIFLEDENNDVFEKFINSKNEKLLTDLVNIKNYENIPNSIQIKIQHELLNLKLNSNNNQSTKKIKI